MAESGSQRVAIEEYSAGVDAKATRFASIAVDHQAEYQAWLDEMEADHHEGADDACPTVTPGRADELESEAHAELARRQISAWRGAWS